MNEKKIRWPVILAILLILVWGLGFFVFSLGLIAHTLLVLALILLTATYLRHPERINRHFDNSPDRNRDQAKPSSPNFSQPNQT